MGKHYGHLGNSYSVCMNCGDRRIGCHGICKDYCEEVENANKVKENRRKFCETLSALNHLDRPKSHRRSENTPQRCHMK